MRMILVKEVMASPAITINVEEPFRRVEEKFRTLGIRHLPVVDATSRVVGMITQRDLYKTVSPRRTEDGLLKRNIHLKRLWNNGKYSLKTFISHVQPEFTIRAILSEMCTNTAVFIPHYWAYYNMEFTRYRL